MQAFDVVIAGAGLIGLSCALELEARGMKVAVVDKGRVAAEASWAAAGMLAAQDSTNPPELTDLAAFSNALYPEFLHRVSELSGMDVPFETQWTLEEVEGWRHHKNTLPVLRGKGYRRINEQSVDPRKLTAAVAEALRRKDIPLLEKSPVRSASANSLGVTVKTPAETLEGGCFLDCTGAWSPSPIHPAKGQVVRVHAPGALAARGMGNIVVRAHDVYMVPRLDGSVVIGATVEDAGFDRTVHDADILHLQAEAAEHLPALADAPVLESWAGLRPDTPDHLPLLGATGDRSFIASGHFRNGILLAPATAHVMAQLIRGEELSVGLDAFAPSRFQPATAYSTKP